LLPWRHSAITAIGWVKVRVMVMVRVRVRVRVRVIVYSCRRKAITAMGRRVLLSSCSGLGSLIVRMFIIPLFFII
jgi:hypothetical protein